MYYIIGCNYVFFIPRVREFFNYRKQARVPANDRNWDPVCNRPQRAKIRERCFVIIESLSKDDGNGNDDPTKQCSDWLNKEI